MANNESQSRFPKITRNRLILAGMVVAGAAVVAIFQPDLARDLFNFFFGGNNGS